MDNTTENSGALSELRPVKFPDANGHFFEAFIPEVVFAIALGIFVAWAYAHYSKLFEAFSKPQTKTETPLEKAQRLISELDTDSADFARFVWTVLREYLMRAYGNPFFPNMTANEAIRAMGGNPAFEGLALLVRTIEYSPLSSLESKKTLQSEALRFLTNEENG